MKPEDTGPLPYKREPRFKDPFLDAIAHNPHPLIMVAVGLIGMPLMLWLTAPDAREVESEAELQSPVEEIISHPIERVPPAPSEPITEPMSSPDAAVMPQDIAPIPFTEPGVSTPAPAPAAVGHGRPSIALIIDDIGYNGPLGERAIALPGAVTYAVLPHTPHGAELAEKGFTAGKEIMLHAPMANQANMPLGPGALTADLDKDTFIATLSDAIDAIPHLEGINNHMGSALTELEEPMRWVMEVLKERQLYFVDSYTTAKSVAGRVASQEHIPTITRNVFLDNVQQEEDIDREFRKLLKMAKERGVAVGIGHPYPETLNYLEMALPLLEQEGVTLIPASEMIALQAQLKAAL